MKKSERIKNFSRFFYSNVLYCYRCHRQYPNEYLEAYLSGHNEPHSKCGSPQGLVGSNPTASAREGTTELLSIRPYFFCSNFL